MIKVNISGMSTKYEEECQKMLMSGINWLEDNPMSNPEFKSIPGVYGVISNQNSDADLLSKEITDAVDDCTGAMHQCVVSHLMVIKKIGYDKWLESAPTDRDAI